MLQKTTPKQNCVIMHVANTDPFTSGRITISYYGSTTNKRNRSWTNIYLRHGRMVVSIANSRKVTLHATLRATLIALAMFPKFLERMPLVRSSYIQSAWVKAFCKVNERKYTHLPLEKLYVKASQSMAVMSNLIYGGRLMLISSPSVTDSIVPLLIGYLELIQHTNTFQNYLKQKQSKKLLK